MTVNRPRPGEVFNLLELAQEREERQGNSRVNTKAVARYGAFVGSVIESHSLLPRAMEHARGIVRDNALAGRSVASGTVILADAMSQSKGRFTRQWHAPGGGVWGCMLHANTLLPQSRRFIPFATGLACCEAVREVGVKHATLRWVNDVLVDGKKLAGFLVEGYTEPIHGEEFTLIGFGINVNNCSFPADLSPLSVSLQQILARETDLSAFTARFLSRLAWNFGLLYHEEARELKGEGFSGKGGKHLLLEKWLDCSDTVGKKIVYGFDVMTEPQYQAEVLGINDDGGLVLRLLDGFEKVEYSGEIRYLQSM
jgi:BirA family biotin operon repressor/biotin-[acetyl-CoA-carboxylase] ligase